MGSGTKVNCDLRGLKAHVTGVTPAPAEIWLQAQMCERAQSELDFIPEDIIEALAVID
jgi:hypothetical protein